MVPFRLVITGSTMVSWSIANALAWRSWVRVQAMATLQGSSRPQAHIRPPVGRCWDMSAAAAAICLRAACASWASLFTAPFLGGMGVGKLRCVAQSRRHCE
ncbi:hypothetical protein Cme02nite_00220 [Catellatospora methionotrophica]|uniref:Uncharacterized protein n=1 Tax=Catellatospora methionotrophica TaxID=121620 RepID=A0A8J3L394_9ACTN|nr:hypothetical protein Cme02nite_00220 [Catellatospora methionotrophica]